MSGDESGNFRGWTNRKTACLANSTRFLPRLAPPAIASDADPGFALTKPSPFEERVQKIFIGRDGLRPIWRLVLYLLMYRGLRFCLFVLLAYGLSDLSFLWRQTAAELGLAIIALAPALLMSRIEGRPFGCYGLPLCQAFGKLFWVGRTVGNGFAHSAASWRCAEHMPFILGRSRLHGVRALKFAVFWAAFFLIVGLLRRILHPRVYPIHPDRRRLASGRRRFCFRWASGRCIWRTREKAGWAFSAPW